MVFRFNVRCHMHLAAKDALHLLLTTWIIYSSEFFISINSRRKFYCQCIYNKTHATYLYNIFRQFAPLSTSSKLLVAIISTRITRPPLSAHHNSHAFKIVLALAIGNSHQISPLPFQPLTRHSQSYSCTLVVASH